jgi:peptidyl-prolyl cis-trans isomerase D
MSTGKNTIDRVKKAWAEGRLSWKSITAIILFSAIILVFVFFGMNQGGQTAISSAARVNNVLISVADFQQELQRMEQMWAMFGPVKGEQRRNMENSTLQRLVSSELAAQTAESEGIITSDEEIREVIVKNIPAFHRDGRFARDQYVAVLEANRLTPGEFERKIRKERLVNRAQSLIEAASQPTKLELDRLQALQGLTVNYSFARIEKAKVLPALSGADEKAKQTKFDELMKSLDEVTQKGDLAAINAVLAEVKVSWAETGFVDFSSAFIPTLGSTVASEATSEVNKAEPLLKRVVKDGDNRFVLQFKDIKKTEPKPLADAATRIAREKSQALFTSWVESERKNATIEINSQVFSR